MTDEMTPEKLAEIRNEALEEAAKALIAASEGEPERWVDVSDDTGQRIGARLEGRTQKLLRGMQAATIVRALKTKLPIQCSLPNDDYNNSDNNSVTGYMCKVDFDYELGCASGGNIVYPSEKNLREHRKCVNECGIVEVRVQFVRVIQEGREYGDEDD